MSSRHLSQLAILTFALLGIAALFTRYQARQSDRVAREDSLWRLAYDVSFNSKLDDSQVRISLPTSSAYVEVGKEEIAYDPIRLHEEVQEYRSTGNRYLVVTTQHPGDYLVNLEYEIRLSPQNQWRLEPLPEILTPDSRARYLRSEGDIYPVTTSSTVQRTLQKGPVGDVTKDETLQWIFELCSRDLLTTSSKEGGDDADWALANGAATPLGKARAMITLCRAARIPARPVVGIELRQVDSPKLHVWVEVYRGHNWIPFDPVYGYARFMPIQFIPLRRGFEHVVRSEGAENVSTEFSVLRLSPAEKLLKTEKRHPLQIFDLTRLPLEMHKVMSLLLLLPFGALITALVRNVVGIQTFGTFAPALLAMSFIYAAWGTGIVILIVVLTAGLFGRGLLERLHILMVPRLSIVLTLVILCVVFCVSLLDYLELTPSAQAVLLPLVILTILIERFHVTAEEDGLVYSLQLTAGTIVVASLCYLILSWDKVGQFILRYPETHLLTIAAFIVVGRYAGYRLTELWRFRDLVAVEVPPRDHDDSTGANQ